MAEQLSRQRANVKAGLIETVVESGRLYDVHSCKHIPPVLSPEAMRCVLGSDLLVPAEQQMREARYHRFLAVLRYWIFAEIGVEQRPAKCL